MKKITSFIIALTIVSGLMFTRCLSSEEKNTETGSPAITTDEPSNTIDSEYKEEYAIYRKEVLEKISVCEKYLADFKTGNEHLRGEALEKYNKETEAITKNNNDLKKRLENYREEGEAHWESFKSKFNHDLDQIDEALKNLKANKNY